MAYHLLDECVGRLAMDQGPLMEWQVKQSSASIASVQTMELLPSNLHASCMSMAWDES